MRYWWVNQNQTYRHEVGGGGYLWSLKRTTNRTRNPYRLAFARSERVITGESA